MSPEGSNYEGRDYVTLQREEVQQLQAEVARLRKAMDERVPFFKYDYEVKAGIRSLAALSGPGDGEPETEWPTAKDLLSWPKECRDAYVRLSAHYAANEGMYAEIGGGE